MILMMAMMSPTSTFPFFFKNVMLALQSWISFIFKLMQKYKITANVRRKDVKILNFCAFLGRNDTGMRIFH